MVKQNKARSFGSILVLLVVEVLALVIISWFSNTLLADAFSQLPVSMGAINIIIVIMMLGAIIIDFVKGVYAITSEKKRKNKKRK